MEAQPLGKGAEGRGADSPASTLNAKGKVLKPPPEDPTPK